MDDETLVTRQPGMLEADAAGEMVGLHVERGVCYGFNATATRLWQMIEQPRTFGQLCDALMAEHEVDANRCRTDVAAVLATLADEELVTLSAR